MVKYITYSSHKALNIKCNLDRTQYRFSRPLKGKWQKLSHLLGERIIIPNRWRLGNQKKTYLGDHQPPILASNDIIFFKLSAFLRNSFLCKYMSNKFIHSFIHWHVHTSARANIWRALPMNMYDYMLPNVLSPSAKTGAPKWILTFFKIKNPPCSSGRATPNISVLSFWHLGAPVLPIRFSDRTHFP